MPDMIKEDEMTERWNTNTNQYEASPEIDSFLADIESACIRHNMSISHEDCGGAFIIERYSEENLNWLKAAREGLEDK